MKTEIIHRRGAKDAEETRRKTKLDVSYPPLSGETHVWFARPLRPLRLCGDSF